MGMRGALIARALLTVGLFTGVISCHSEAEHAAGEASLVEAAPARDPKIEALVAEIDAARLKSQLTTLVNLGTRQSTSAEFVKALEFCEGELTALGYAPKRQSVRVSGKETFNLIWERKGTGDGVVVVGAHLDSVNQSFSGDRQAPGADDNGSGSVGALEIARVFATRTPEKTLRFVLFTGEEQGLYGSEAYVASLSAAEKAKITAVLNMDMIATRNGTGGPGVLLEGATRSQAMLDGLAAAGATYTTLAVKTSLRAYNSDHVSFLEAGIPAVLTIEANDLQNRNMHTKNDTLDKIDWSLMTSILTMNIAYLAGEVGLGEPAPENGDAGNGNSDAGSSNSDAGSSDSDAGSDEVGNPVEQRTQAVDLGADDVSAR